ncbi:hypothetical protein MRB53_000927 [Persea americana]|uniref:Uncharacterized protein n=1 Tax=Persea americana TaxID=3435 RepID=A0ACC2MQ88_PERAE|nr:hypothetical protein MRB53_000927 [Persea americana]
MNFSLASATARFSVRCLMTRIMTQTMTGFERYGVDDACKQSDCVFNRKVPEPANQHMNMHMVCYMPVSHNPHGSI